MEADERRVRARWLLGLGAAAGLTLAASSLLSGPGRNAGELPEGAVARVNDAIIRNEEYARLLAALASDRRNPLTEEDRRRLLDRLIEEELLVQRARELGVDRLDRRVRSILVSAMIDSIVAEAGKRIEQILMPLGRRK